MIGGNRKCIESLYDCKADVFEYVKIKDPSTKRMTTQAKKVLSEIPCRLSYRNVYVESADEGNRLEQRIRLFLSPKYSIKPGAKITVTKNGVEDIFINATKPRIYTNHQEIDLELFKGWT